MQSLLGLDSLLQRCRNLLPALEEANKTLERENRSAADASETPASQRRDGEGYCHRLATSSLQERHSTPPLPATDPESSTSSARSSERQTGTGLAPSLNAEVLTLEEEEGSRPHVELELHLGVFDVNGDIPPEESLRELNIPVVDSGVNLHAQEDAVANSLADPVRFLLEQKALEQRLKTLGEASADDEGWARGPGCRQLIQVLSSGDESSDEEPEDEAAELAET